MSVRAVLLDLYDTLVWSEWPVMRGEIEREFGIDEQTLIRAFVQTRPARSVGAFGSAQGDLKAVLDAAGVQASPERLRELSEDRVARFLAEGVHLWEDSMPALRELRDRGIRTAIVSNCDHSTRPVVERLGLVEATDATILSFEAGVAKPERGIYERALESVGASPHEAVFVDDQVRYCDGAAEIGLPSFLIIRDGAAPEEGVSTETHGYPVLTDLRGFAERL